MPGSFRPDKSFLQLCNVSLLLSIVSPRRADYNEQRFFMAVDERMDGLCRIKDNNCSYCVSPLPI